MTIWKFPVSIDDHFTLQMPRGAKVLSVGVQATPQAGPPRPADQREVPFLWALVDPDPDLGTETRHFLLAGTGHPRPDLEWLKIVFIGTFQLRGGALVFHLFERISP